MQPPIIYNLFPRYFDTLAQWATVLPDAAAMGCSHVFVNAFHATGFSGSLYAVQDYFRLNPLLLGAQCDPEDFSPLEAFVAAARMHGLTVIMDLVVNHTAVDAPLTETHPEWYLRTAEGGLVHPGAQDDTAPGGRAVWGDLARLDLDASPDRDGLWAFFDRVVAFYQHLGITCFRCDAAYQVSADFWRWLIARARDRAANSLFLAETLGCQPDEVLALRGVGFDYLYNSSKWWQYEAPWCLEQHAAYQAVAPSISFPETHDTDRLTRTGPATREYQQSRYVLAALFASGVMLPMGFEYGARIKPDVVHGVPADGRERPLWDLGGWIAAVHRLKRRVGVFGEEGRWEALTSYGADLFAMRKESSHGQEPVVLLVNTTAGLQVAASAELPLADAAGVVYPAWDPGRVCAVPEQLTFGPHEIVLAVGPRARHSLVGATV